MPEKTHWFDLPSKGILADFEWLKTFAKIPYASVNFDEKHDDDVSELLRPMVLKLQ